MATATATAEGPTPRGGDPAESTTKFTAGSQKSFITDDGESVGGRDDDYVVTNAAAQPKPRLTQRQQRGRKSSVDDAGQDARDANDGNLGEGEEDVTLSKDSLCPGMEDALLNTFKTFDGNGNGCITQKV